MIFNGPYDVSYKIYHAILPEYIQFPGRRPAFFRKGAIWAKKSQKKSKKNFRILYRNGIFVKRTTNLKASFLKNIEVEAVILLFIIGFLSFWPLRQCRAGGQKPRENLNVN